MEKKKTMPRLTVRLSPNQMQVLYELTKALGVTYSQLVRAIILNFLTVNEERLERIIDKKERLEINGLNEEEDD